MNTDLAELVGVFIGDGCLSRYFSKYDGRYKKVVLFTGNLENDMEYYEKVLKPIIINNFGVSGYIYFRKDDCTIRYSLFCSKIIEFLFNLGFKFGSKSSSCKIPDAINSRNLEIACVRGIFNSDGTVYRRYGRRFNNHKVYYKNYAVVQFKMKSKTLVSQIRYILQRNGFKVNKLTNTERYSLIRITDQKYVEMFFNEIATNHHYHLQRYANIKNN
jgi:hypothetical protein